MQENAITIESTVNAPVSKVWELWNNPEHITKWAFASDDWEAPHAKNDLRVGGKFITRMSAKDGSEGFDFTGIYSTVDKYSLIEYDMSDGRQVKVKFEETPEGTKITETFDPENENPLEMQKQGWQEILNNFKRYVEKN